MDVSTPGRSPCSQANADALLSRCVPKAYQNGDGLFDSHRDIILTRLISEQVVRLAVGAESTRGHAADLEHEHPERP